MRSHPVDFDMAASERQLAVLESVISEARMPDFPLSAFQQIMILLKHSALDQIRNCRAVQISIIGELFSVRDKNFGSARTFHFDFAPSGQIDTKIANENIWVLRRFLTGIEEKESKKEKRI